MACKQQRERYNYFLHFRLQCNYISKYNLSFFFRFFPLLINSFRNKQQEEEQDEEYFKSNLSIIQENS